MAGFGFAITPSLMVAEARLAWAHREGETADLAGDTKGDTEVVSDVEAMVKSKVGTNEAAYWGDDVSSLLRVISSGCSSSFRSP